MEYKDDEERRDNCGTHPSGLLQARVCAVKISVNKETERKETKWRKQQI
jgi:hypothetical protein